MRPQKLWQTPRRSTSPCLTLAIAERRGSAASPHGFFARLDSRAGEPTIATLPGPCGRPLTSRTRSRRATRQFRRQTRGLRRCLARPISIHWQPANRRRCLRALGGKSSLTIWARYLRGWLQRCDDLLNHKVELRDNLRVLCQFGAGSFLLLKEFKDSATPWTAQGVSDRLNVVGELLERLGECKVQRVILHDRQ